MVLWSVQAKNTHHSPFLLRSSFPEKVVSQNLRSFGLFRDEVGRVSQILVSSRTPAPWRSLIVKARAKKNRDNSSSSSSEDGNWFAPGGDPKENSSDGNKFDDTTSPKNKHVILDWREVRANLFRREQAEKADSQSDAQDKAGTEYESKPLGLKWAHPITVPETGCVLVATEKLDGVSSFERTVILLLRSGNRHPDEGPFGVVINRPHPKKMRHIKSTNLELRRIFAGSTLHLGGPLEGSMFLLDTGKKIQKLPGFEEVIPGLLFGARDSLDEAAEFLMKGVLKPQDFRFFVGYAGWQLDQLREEIDSNYWYVAACSPNLILEGSSSSDGLWHEILELMGGQYSELSRKPKEDI